jgi:phage shock protein C
MDHAARHLKRSRRDRVFGGVCGGLSEYLGWDAVLVRVAYVVLAIISFGLGGILLYLLAWMIIPLEEPRAAGEVYAAPAGAERNNRVIVGVFLAIAGALALASSFLPWFWHWSDWRIVGPLMLVLFGIFLVIWKGQKAPESVVSPMSVSSTPNESYTPPDGASARKPRLTRSHRGRKIAGICAGLGKYLDIDPTIVRLIFIVLLFVGGSALLLYLILWVAMPLEEESIQPR